MVSFWYVYYLWWCLFVFFSVWKLKLAIIEKVTLPEYIHNRSKITVNRSFSTTDRDRTVFVTKLYSQISQPNLTLFIVPLIEADYKRYFNSKQKYLRIRKIISNIGNGDGHGQVWKMKDLLYSFLFIFFYSWNYLI